MNTEVNCSQGETVLAALLIAVPIIAVWHMEIAMVAGNIDCSDFATMTNGFWSAPGCQVVHVWMYILFAVNWSGALYLLLRR